MANFHEDYELEVVDAAAASAAAAILRLHQHCCESIFNELNTGGKRKATCFRTFKFHIDVYAFGISILGSVVFQTPKKRIKKHSEPSGDKAMFSAKKKVQGGKPEPPCQGAFDEALIETYKSKGKDRSKLPIIAFTKRVNKKQKEFGWMKPLLVYSDEFYSIVSFFFFGDKYGSLFKDATSNIEVARIPGISVFEGILEDVTVKVENPKDFKLNLIDAIKMSYGSDLTKKHPVVELLRATINKLNEHKEDGGIGWLLETNMIGKKLNDRSNLDSYVATALYNIIGAGCEKEYNDILATALGSTAKNSAGRKQFVKDIAKNYVLSLMKNSDHPKSSAGTATTATALSSTDKGENLNTLRGSESLSGTGIFPTEIKTNEPYTVRSPLTGTSKTTTVFFDKKSEEVECTATNPSSFEGTPNIQRVLYTEEEDCVECTAASTNSYTTSNVESGYSDDHYDDDNANDFGSPIVALFQDDSGRSSQRSFLISPRFRRPSRKGRSTPTNTTPPSALRQTKRFRNAICSKFATASQRASILLSDDHHDAVENAYTRGRQLLDAAKRGAATESARNEAKELVLKNYEGLMNKARKEVIKFLLDTSENEESHVFDIIQLMISSNEEAKAKEKLIKKLGSYLYNQSTKDSNAVVDAGHKLLYPFPKLRQWRSSANDKNRDKYIKIQAKIVKDFTEKLLADKIQLIDDVILHLASETKAGKKQKGKLISASQVAAAQSATCFNVSSAATVKICRRAELLAKKNGLIGENDRLFEGQLLKKLGRVEADSAIPPKVVQVECQITEKDTGFCTYYYIQNVPLLLERLVARCMMEGKFRPSNKFSKLSDKIIIKFGTDRGMGDLIMQLSLANRENGNHGTWAIPIGVVESATESHSNLKKTVYAEERKTILEQLVNDELHMIAFSFNDPSSSTLKYVKCLILQFEGVSRTKMENKSIVCTIDQEPLLVSDLSDIEWNSIADERTDVDSVKITSRMISRADDEDFPIRIQLIEHQNEYVGCNLVSYKTEEKLFSFRFDVHVDREEIRCITARCFNCYGKACEDGKMIACVHGLSAVGSSYPCPICLWHLRDTVAASWVEKHASEDVCVECKDFEQRTGEKSLSNSNYNYRILRSGQTAAAKTSDKVQAYSVVDEPLLRMEDDKIYKSCPDEMHVRQGEMTHLTQQLCFELSTIRLTDDDDFIDTMEEKINQYIGKMVQLEQSDEFVKNRRERKKIDKEVNLAYSKYTEAVDEGKTQREIDELFQTFDDYAYDRAKEDLDPEKFVVMNKKINGGKEMKKLLAVFKNDKKKRFNKAVYTFMKALKTYAGDIYKGKGVHELTGKFHC